MSYITSKQFAETLNVSRATLLARVRRGEIQPLNKEDWQIDGEYLFAPEEVGRVKELYKKPGLSVKEVAERLNLSHTRIHQLIRRPEDPLPATLHFYNGRDSYFIREEDLAQFIANDHIEVNRQKGLMSKKYGFFLFQLFWSEAMNEYARIMDIYNDEEGIALTEGDKKLSLSQLSLEGFKPMQEIKQKRPITAKGYVKFLFPKSNQIKASTYRVIDELYRSAGARNIRFLINEHDVEIEVKPTILPYSNVDSDDLHLLKSSVVEGHVVVRANGDIRLESDLEPISAFAPSAFKEAVRRQASELNITIEGYVLHVLEEDLRKSKEETH